MKKAILTGLCLFAISAFVSCNANKTNKILEDTNVDSSKMITIKIDPTNDRDKINTIHKASSIFDSVKYFPLETNKNSIFSDISQLEVTAKRFIILDRSTKSILIFNRMGKFISRFSTSASFFAVNYQKKEILVPDFHSKPAIYIYDLDGNLQAEEAPLLYFRNFVSLDSNLLAYYPSFENIIINSQLKKSYNLPTPANLLIINNYKLKSSYLSFDTARINFVDTYNTPKTFYKHKDEYYFVQPYDYHIYSLNKNSLFKSFKFIFPVDNSIPTDFRTNSKYRNLHMSYLQQNRDRIFIISDFYRLKSNIFFKIYSNGELFSNIYHFNIESQTLTPFSTIGFDSAVNYMPIGMSLQAVETNSVFTSASASFLTEFFWKTKGNNNPKIHPEIKNQFSLLSNRDNPVIIQLYPKSN